MSDIHLLLLGYALGAVPSAEFARIVITAVGKRAGVKPREIERYSDATDADGGET